MSSLIDTYASYLGVIPKQGPILNLAFFPCPDKFITIHGGDDRVKSKTYPLFAEVISLLKPVLSKLGYRIIQIGGKNDMEIDGVDGKYLGLTFPQTFYVQSKSSLHLGIDSMPIHSASGLGVPTIALYSHIYPEQSPINWLPDDKKIILEPEWNNRKPSYQPNESPKMIRTIKVEKVVQAVFDLLCKGVQLNMKTIRVGEDYYNPVMEIVPDHFQENPALKNGYLHFRMDLQHNEQCLFHWLAKGYKTHIISRKPITLDSLKQFRPNIGRLILMADSLESFSAEYLKAAKNIGLDVLIFCEKKEILPQMREKFFDYVIEELDYPEQKLVDKIPKDAKFFTKKQLISNGQTFPSVAHYKNNIPFSRANQIIDSQDFWLDTEYFYFYL